MGRHNQPLQGLDIPVETLQRGASAPSKEFLFVCFKLRKQLPQADEPPVSRNMQVGPPLTRKLLWGWGSGCEEV